MRKLSPQLLQGLAYFLNKVEQAGRWPAALCVTLIALIPKEGAQTEGELRPIGLTPVIYRVWMCIRKHRITAWTRSLYGLRVLSSTDHAWNTRVEQEISRAPKKFFGVVYLDCHKCYERVPHLGAAQSAWLSGCPGQIVNLVFSLYAGARHLSVHGAISQKCGGNTGLIAGCGFAVHILKAYLNVGDTGWKAQVRTYVDDITLSVVANTHSEVVRILGHDLPKIKSCPYG